MPTCRCCCSWIKNAAGAIFFLLFSTMGGGMRCAESFETELSPKKLLAKWHNIAMGKWETGWGNAAFCWGNAAICWGNDAICWGNEANLLGKWSKWMGKWSKMCWGDAQKVKWTPPHTKWLDALRGSSPARYINCTGLFHFTYRASPQHILLHFPIHLLHFPNKFASFPQQIASFPQQIAAFPQQIAAFPQPVSHFPNAMLCHFTKN